MNTALMSPSQLQLRGTLLVALSGMLYGLIGYLGTELFHEHFSVANMLFWRFLIATFWMLGSITLLRKKNSESTQAYSSLVKVILFGAVTYSGGSAFYFMASTHIGTGVGMVIFFSFPVFVTLFAWLFSGWRINKHTFASLVAVVTGLLLLKGQGQYQLDIFGLFFAILAAFCYASYVYGSQHSAKTIDSRLLTFLICFANTVIFLILSCYTHSLSVPVTPVAWCYVLALGIIATAVPIQLLLDGLKYISPVKASILSVLEPVVTVIIGLALLHEKMSYTQSIGVIIVLLGAILIQFERIADHT
ncbi:DMT family transporter [Aquicella lusitana]|uniref:Threonine/homoserine efflux transporter RhtA n=1 Tax=Aquicella lusitana TaxID=254246 RepID=A0A370GFU9_9COXI|nr:DMT family transporter [Aquicella lusitana]RDI42551.1 threonine/homoserine efflux transporter RhtA [Aquicella lusitana]VVC74330.1 hypothetical protein AQULUS_20950 [Aquicella lusitana]